MIYRDSRYLSSKLDIRLSKWKRWAREFLPPDPLGGLQSGVARQFNTKDAFKVYLGGHLVGQLKFSIPDAARILTDLCPWLEGNGFFSIQPQLDDDLRRSFPQHHIYIYVLQNNGLQNKKFVYCIRTIQSLKVDDLSKQETSSIELISTDFDPIDSGDVSSAQLLAITTIYLAFLNSL
jgi:hypothetical protein